jgi:hypothetical protein
MRARRQRVAPELEEHGGSGLRRRGGGSVGCIGPSFYQHHEFAPLADHPNKLFIAIVILDKLFQAH